MIETKFHHVYRPLEALKVSRPDPNGLVVFTITDEDYKELSIKLDRRQISKLREVLKEYDG